MLLTRVCLAALAALAIGLVPVTPAAAHGSHAGADDPLLIPSASWHGRPIQNPHRHEAVRSPAVEAPRGWSAGSVSFGAGYHRPGGSDRVRELQKRLRRLGYRPGPVDGLFGPRTRAAVAWFQVKHGLPLHGRATFVTVRHLRAATRGGEPARSVAAGAGGRRPPRRAPPSATPPRTNTTRADRVAADDGGSSPAGYVPLLLLLASLLAGLAVFLRRSRATSLSEVPAPAQSRARALAYVLVAAGEPRDAQLQLHTRAVEAECAAHGLALAGLVADAEDDRLIWQRPGLQTAVGRLVRGEVDFLMVTRMEEAAGPDLEHLAKTVEGEIAIARWQQEPRAGEREVSHA
jgi:hypothetical protein